MNSYEKKLRTVLKINALFSLTSGLDAILFNHSLSDLIGISNPIILIYIGLGLILFSVLVFNNAFKKEINAKAIKSVIL